MNVAKNPVARAVEKARVKKYFTDNAFEIMAARDGEEKCSLLQGVAETMAIAIKSIEGIDDPHDIGGILVDAMAPIVEMSGDGFKWRAAYAAQLIDALDYAVQILLGVDPADRIKGWAWAQEINRAMAQKVAA